MSIINYNASFDGVQLTSIAGLTILRTDAFNVAKRKIDQPLIARNHKSALTGAFYTEKNITVRVCIQTASRDNTEQNIDSLIKILQGLKKDLVVAQSKTTRRYICTLADVVVQSGGTSYWEADLVFTCVDRFGYDTAYTAIANLTGIASGIRSDQFTVDGSAPSQCPVIQVKITAVTGGTSGTILVGNQNNGQQLTITRTWVVGDILIVDTLNQNVSVNGVEVSFSGAFPEFTQGLGVLTYFDSFTTRTFDYLAYYYKRYA